MTKVLFVEGKPIQRQREGCERETDADALERMIEAFHMSRDDALAFLDELWEASA